MSHVFGICGVLCRPHVDLLIAILAVLSNICRHEHLVPYVLSAPDSIVILSERLQFFRDSEEVSLVCCVCVYVCVTAAYQNFVRLCLRVPRVNSYKAYV